jgi:hypothetical protein
MQVIENINVEDWKSAISHVKKIEADLLGKRSSIRGRNRTRRNQVWWGRYCH